MTMQYDPTLIDPVYSETLQGYRTDMTATNLSSAAALVSKSKILVVEDETDVRNLMMLHLKREGYDAVETADGESALDIVSKDKFNLLILDWMLPGLSGLEVCKALQRKVPVLMVTARADSTDIVGALDAGADDYITKPFQISVFNARVRALLRRSTEAGPVTRFEVANLIVDTESHQALCDGSELKLTPSEFKALLAMLQFEGRILSRTKLMSMVQGEGIRVTDRAIDTLIFGLRKNMGACAALVETVRGVGYRLRAPKTSA